MAAFSAYKHPVFLAEPAFLPNNVSPGIKMDGVLDEFVPNFHQFYSSFGNCDNQQNSSFDASAHESSCIEQQSIHNETEKQRYSESLSMANKAESGEQVTQTPVRSDKKRKSRNGSSLHSANSKDAKQLKSKKQKGDKDNFGEINDKKNEKKDQTKNVATEEPPKGYIHVRARRGQATDSHSLAERVRREKISERMKMLQGLVPGCDKVTGKALMLDEIINYVQSLQNQVEFLSMKLSSLDPMVYTFGLMDLDTILFGADLQGNMNNNNMGFPIPLLSIQSGSGSASGSTSPTSQTNVFGTANSCLSSPATSSTFSPTFPNPHVDNSTNLLRHDQTPNFLPYSQQEGGSLYWPGVNEQERQSSNNNNNIMNQFGINGNNLYSLLQ